MPALALRASQRMLALGGDHAVVRRWLRPVAEQMLRCPSRSTTPTACAWRAGGRHGRLRRLRMAGAHRSRQPGQPAQRHVFAVPGRHGLHRGLWGRAQLLLTQAARRLPAGSLRRHTWQALAALAEQRGDEAAASQA